VRAVRQASPLTTVELLIPDFQGDRSALATLLEAPPDILAHNVETVPRLYKVRSGADYGRSLELLRRVTQGWPKIPLKSGIMLGLGERPEEVRAVLDDLRSAGCSYLSVGQYLAPSRRHQAVVEFVRPELFDSLRHYARTLGFQPRGGRSLRAQFLSCRRLHKKRDRHSLCRSVDTGNLSD